MSIESAAADIVKHILSNHSHNGEPKETVPVNFDALIDEAQAAMPCYDADLSDNYRQDGLYTCSSEHRIPQFEYRGHCPSCQARARLAAKEAAVG